MKRSLVFSAVPVLAALGVGLSSGQVPKPVEGPPPTVKRVYDVGDLVGNSADPKDVDAGLDRVKEVIVQTVDNASWKDNGGETGSITQFNRELIVIQTPANQDDIRDLLQTLREQATGHRTIVTDAYAVWLTPEQLKQNPSTVPASVLADPRAVYRHVRLTGVEGERNAVGETGPGRSILSPTNAEATTRPDVTAAPPAPALILSETATVSDEGATVVVKLDFSIAAPAAGTEGAVGDAPATRPAAEGVGNSGLSLQTRTTVRLHAGVPMIVSGTDDTPGAADGRLLCLVVCASVAK